MHAGYCDKGHFYLESHCGACKERNTSGNIIRVILQK